MTKLNVGDKIMITNVDAIEFGSYYWRDGDVVEVLGIDSGGDYQVHTPRWILHSDVDKEGFIDGKHWFYVSEDELHAVAKVLPPNAQKEEPPQAGEQEHFFDVYVVQVRANVRAASPAEAERKVREGLSPIDLMRSRVTAYHVGDVNQRWEGGKP